MKVILLNGSRREKGCTYTALSVVAIRSVKTASIRKLSTPSPTKASSRPWLKS